MYSAVNLDQAAAPSPSLPRYREEYTCNVANLKHDEWVARYADARRWQERLRVRLIHSTIRWERTFRAPSDGAKKTFIIPGRKQGRRVTLCEKAYGCTRIKPLQK